MNYKKIYKNLFNKARSRNIKEFKKTHSCIEKHHFIPRSLFEDKEAKQFLCDLLEVEHNNINDNVYPLTCKEHYIAHLLLWKIFEKENISENAREKMLWVVINSGYFLKNSKVKLSSFDKEMYLSNNVPSVFHKILSIRDGITFARYSIYDRCKYAIKYLETYVLVKYKNKYLYISENEYFENIHKYKLVNCRSLTIYDFQNKKYKKYKTDYVFENLNNFFITRKKMIYVKDIEDNKYYRVSEKEFWKNRNKYKNPFFDEYIVDNKKFTLGELYLLYGQKYFSHVILFDKKNKRFIRVSKNNKNIKTCNNCYGNDEFLWMDKIFIKKPK